MYLVFFVSFEGSHFGNKLVYGIPQQSTFSRGVVAVAGTDLSLLTVVDRGLPRFVLAVIAVVPTSNPVAFSLRIWASLLAREVAASLSVIADLLRCRLFVGQTLAEDFQVVRPV